MAPPSAITSDGLGEPGDVADRREPTRVQLPGGRRPDAPESLDWEGMEEGKLAVGVDDE